MYIVFFVDRGHYSWVQKMMVVTAKRSFVYSYVLELDMRILSTRVYNAFHFFCWLCPGVIVHLSMCNIVSWLRSHISINPWQLLLKVSSLNWPTTSLFVFVPNFESPHGLISLVSILPIPSFNCAKKLFLLFTSMSSFIQVTPSTLYLVL